MTALSALARLGGLALAAAVVAPTMADAGTGRAPFEMAPPVFGVAAPAVRNAARMPAMESNSPTSKVPNPAFAGYLASRTGAARVVAQLKVPGLVCTRKESAISPGAFLLAGPSDREEFSASNIIVGCYRGHPVAEEALIVNDVEVNYRKQLYPGDTMRVRLIEEPGRSTVVELRDLTSGHAFVLTRRGRGAAGDAELVGDWGSVDIHTGAQLPPPRFGTITFTRASVGGKPLGSSPLTAYEMQTPAKVLQISIGPLFGASRDSFRSKRTLSARQVRVTAGSPASAG